MLHHLLLHRLLLLLLLLLWAWGCAQPGVHRCTDVRRREGPCARAAQLLQRTHLELQRREGATQKSGVGSGSGGVLRKGATLCGSSSRGRGGKGLLLCPEMGRGGRAGGGALQGRGSGGII